MSDLYPQRILDHYREPHHYGPLPDATHEGHTANPLCGDEVTVHLRLSEDGTIAAASFEGVGCAISQAAASLLMQRLQGASVAELNAITDRDVVDLLGAPISPRRMTCALLAVHAAREAVAQV